MGVAIQIALTALGILLSVLLSVLLWQTRQWVGDQRRQAGRMANMQVDLTGRIAALEAAIAALRLELAQQRTDERERADERTRRVWERLEEVDRAASTRIAEALREHRETCRAAQDAITGVRAMPTDPHGVPQR